MPKKAFVSKKNADAFQLVHRSQRDPLHDTDGASAFVLRPVGQPGEVALPQDVLPGGEAPSARTFNPFCVEMDQEIADALDAGSDDEYEELPDDFVQLATGGELPHRVDDDDADGFDASDDDVIGSDDDEPPRDALLDALAADAEVYDAAADSTDMRSLLSSRLDRALEQDDEELEDDDPAIRGPLLLSDARVSDVLDEFLAAQPTPARSAPARTAPAVPDTTDGDDDEPRVAAEEDASSSSSDELELSDDEEQWDCESILSTRSNLDNHPARIGEPQRIRLSAKTGLPIGVLPCRPVRRGTDGSAAEPDAAPDRTVAGGGVPLGIARNRDETADEKRARKAQMKAMRQQSRARKKQYKQAFQLEQRAQDNARRNRAPTSIPM